MTKRLDIAMTARARLLRRDMTDAERRLWEALRSRQLDGHRFRRQHPIGQYIADFACVEQKLVIEIDGGQHQERFAYDEQRTKYMIEQGWKVLRFWNNDVLGNMEGVYARIAEELGGLPPS